MKHFGLSDRVDFQIGTLSKAIGVVGGYVAGKQNLIDWLKVAVKSILILDILNTGRCGSKLQKRLKFSWTAQSLE